MIEQLVTLRLKPSTLVKLMKAARPVLMADLASELDMANYNKLAKSVQSASQMLSIAKDIQAKCEAGELDIIM